jgi:ribose transport system ATP-binding protein
MHGVARLIWTTSLCARPTLRLSSPKHKTLGRLCLGGPIIRGWNNLANERSELLGNTTAPVTISVTNVTKFFGPTCALNGCSFSARAGEIHAIVGGNGSGKSTLAKIVSGVLPIDKGQVSVFGETPSTPAESRAIGISTVYQEVLVADESTVVDNLFMGTDALFSATIPFGEKVARAATMMAELAGEEIDPFSLVGTLPLGIKQWITIGRGLLQNPRILILDESSAALDLDSTERLFAKMRELRDAGTTVLIVTHRIAELIRISDRATVLRDGRDVGVLEKAQITEKNLLTLITGEDQNSGHLHHEAPQPISQKPMMRVHDLAIWPDAEPFDFELLGGEIVGIAGLDGHGQDEFVRILAGVQSAAMGLPLVADATGDFHQVQSLDDAVNAKIVYVSGDRKREGIFDELSIFENMLIPLYGKKSRGGKLGIIDWGTLRAIFAREVENLSIKFGVAADKITSLSGGNQQKVLIGRGFAMRPDIIVLNDPARGIDVAAKTELYKHLRKFVESGKSVVYMSSELEEFIGFATRVIVFRDGSPFDAFAGEAVQAKGILEAMFGQTKRAGLTPGKVPATTPEPILASDETSSLKADVTTDTPSRSARRTKPKIKIVEFGIDGRQRTRGAT